MRNAIFAGLVASSIAVGVDAQQAVQWRVSDGGNGHWYLQLPFGSQPSWAAAYVFASSRGAHLATITSAGEQAFIRSLITPATCEPFGGYIWLGGEQPAGLPPQSGWRWVTGEAWSYQVWEPGEPNDFNGWAEDRLCMYVSSGGWADCRDRPPSPACNWAGLLEWSADCNGDGAIDYGQIQSGVLLDLNLNGVPDCCETSTSCCLGDAFQDGAVNGIDLGVLLGQWGIVNQSTVTDFNQDGVVDGADLGQLLAAWGPCPT
jgi:hypothetical protein